MKVHLFLTYSENRGVTCCCDMNKTSQETRNVSFLSMVIRVVLCNFFGEKHCGFFIIYLVL